MMWRSRSSMSTAPGFALIELLIVVAIIAILAAFSANLANQANRFFGEGERLSC